MTTGRKAFYVREGQSFIPTGLGVSPWNGHSQVGMALAGLAGHVLDAVPSAVPMLTTRISIEIFGTVPLEPLVPRIRMLRDGKRMQIVDAEFTVGDRTWLRATAVRARLAESTAREQPPTRRFWTESDSREEHFWFEERHIDLDRTRVGPGSVWVRFTADVVEGEPLSPLATIAMLGDFGNGTAPVMSMDECTLANLDITVYASRTPRDDWLLIDADSETAGNGLGYARTRIGDRKGMFATAMQSIFIEPRTELSPPLRRG